MTKYVIDEVISSMQRQTWSETLTVGKKKALPGFPPSHERDESTALLHDLKKKEQERSRRPNFLLSACKKGTQETNRAASLPISDVTAIDLGRRLVSSHQSQKSVRVP